MSRHPSPSAALPSCRHRLDAPHLQRCWNRSNYS